MSIPMNTNCVQCLLNKHLEAARALDAAKANAFAKDLLQVLMDALDRSNSAAVAAKINQLYEKHFDLGQDRYIQEKNESNAFVKPRLPAITDLVEQQKDPVFAALQFAILGNYLDFSALNGQVSFEKLDQMLSDALKMQLDQKVYAQFCADLAAGKKLLYITDNAGEIGFDRILAEQLQKKYPQLQITFCVRGLPAHNDATREDAAFMEINWPVVDTGNDIGGVEISLLSPEAKKALDESDVVIAKGMGNTETMHGCKYNVYYAFLVKCARFEEYFQKPHLQAMFIK